ncbi:MAG: hypothetical protein QCI38_08765 [Candidatus Thermoplasmatota archaeon]|nr:hypothetical protein [Candidatus Thermoplasmatota archaeon]
MNMKIAAITMCVILLSLGGAGCIGREQQTWGLVGYNIQIPATYIAEYKSYSLGGDTGAQREEINVYVSIDPSSIKARPVYATNFAEMAKTWIGQRIPRLNNQEAIADDYKRLENTEPAPDEEFVSADHVVDTSGTGDGYTIYVGGKWDLTFLNQSGLAAHQKTFRNAVLLRIPSRESGVHRSEHTVMINVYTPKWRLPDTREVECRLDWELQKMRIQHNWEYGDVWQEYVGDGRELVRNAIDQGQARLRGTIPGVGDFMVNIGVVLLAVAALAVFPVSIVAAVGLLTAACVLQAVILIKDSSGQTVEVPAVEQKGYQTPELVGGSGFVTFTLVLEEANNVEMAATIRPEEGNNK